MKSNKTEGFVESSFSDSDPSGGNILPDPESTIIIDFLSTKSEENHKALIATRGLWHFGKFTNI